MWGKWWLWGYLGLLVGVYWVIKGIGEGYWLIGLKWVYIGLGGGVVTYKINLVDVM